MCIAAQVRESAMRAGYSVEAVHRFAQTEGGMLTWMQSTQRGGSVFQNEELEFDDGSRLMVNTNWAIVYAH